MNNKILKRKDENGLKINHQIRAPFVKLVGENVTMNVYSIKDAIKIKHEPRSTTKMFV